MVVILLFNYIITRDAENKNLFRKAVRAAVEGEEVAVGVGWAVAGVLFPHCTQKS